VLAQITARELYARLKADEVQVIDVRTQSEYVESHIPGAIHIHAGHLAYHLDEIPRHKPVVINCLGGDRSSVAASYLQAQGFTQVINLTGGIRTWWAERYPVETGDETSPMPA